MPDSPPLDVAQAHRHFAADCFNGAWDLIEKPDRSPADNEQMLLCALASLWHWTQREDCTEQNLSIGYWQVSRVYALLGQAENAMRFGELSLRHSGEQPPFFLGYAHEALARAATMAGDAERAAIHLQAARELAAAVADAEERAVLEKDLGTIG